MDKIELRRAYNTNPNVFHLSVLVNGKEVGILYLNRKETDLLLKLVNLGVYNSEIDFSEDIFSNETEEEE